MLLECRHCSALVEARDVATHIVAGNPVDPANLPERWTLAACPRCNQPILAMQIDFGDGFEADTPTRYYPPPDRRLGWSVPKPIREAFAEAVACFKAKAYTACAIMCRKTLEGLCEEHGAKERTLEQSLKKLKDSGVIVSRLFEWAEELRQTGNVAAHGVGVQTNREDASDILEFTEALAEYVFTYRDRFRDFKALRAKGLEPKSAA